ncbi:MAG TPA: PAS domain-containing protein, partial [Ramlibacter sp.]|nr:PAS domain-containing protein [Ramlibacter sp.]
MQNTIASAAVPTPAPPATRHRGPLTVMAASWPLVVAIAVLLALHWGSMRLANAARAYVAGEGLWSKSQNDATRQLLRYAASGRQADYEAFERQVAVPLGDRRARVALEGAVPGHWQEAHEGFLAGRNHPDDIPGMIVLFWLARHYPAFETALIQWRTGDALVARMVAVAGQLRALPEPARHASTAALVREIEEIGQILRPVEDAFSEAIGTASRELSLILNLAALCVAAATLGLGLQLNRRVLARLHRAERQLRHTNQRLELATAGAGSGVWDWNLAERQMYWSGRLMALLGLTARHGVEHGLRLRRRLHPQDAPGTLAALREHFRGATALFDSEFRLRRGDGHFRWFHVRGKAQCDAAGRPERFTGTIADVEARKSAEQSRQRALDSLRRKAEELEVALDGADMALWGFAPATGTVDYALRWERLLGHARMPATLTQWAALVHPGDLPQRRLQFERLARGEDDVYEMEFRMLHAHGHWVAVRSRGRLLAPAGPGTPRRFASAVTDNAAHLAARSLEQHQSQFLKALLETVDTGLFVASRSQLVYMNASLRRGLGYAPEEDLAGLPIERLYPTEELAAEQQRRGKALQGARLPVALVRLRRKTGGDEPMVLNFSAFDWQGEPHFIAAGSPVSNAQAMANHIAGASSRFDRALLSELEAQQAQIARELHDVLGSTLTGISLLLGGMRPALGPGQGVLVLERALEQVTAAIATTRALARGLAPVGPHPGDTLRALQRLAADMQVVAGLDCTFDTRGTPAAIPP